MNKKQKTMAVIGFIGLLILILMMRGKRETTVSEEVQSAAVPVVGGTIIVPPMGGITIPSLNFPPRDGPITWPSLDWGGSQSGISTCGCDGGNSAPIARPQYVSNAPGAMEAIPTAKPVVRKVVEAAYGVAQKVGSSLSVVWQ